MPRQERQQSATGIYHVMLKGINKQDIFEEGYCQAESYVYNSSQDEFTFCYYDRDHLGNNREVVDAGGTLLQRTTYYPFGSEMKMENPALLTGDFLQPFRFTGKELDRLNGLNMYDFGARWYDVAGVPMWTSIDPLCEKYYNLSPYAYCGGNPINVIDPNGCDWISAKYGNELFVYYDSRISSQKDIIEQYYNGEQRDFYNIQYVGTSGTIYGITNNEEKIPYIALNTDGTYTFDGKTENTEYTINGMLHVGTSLQELADKESNRYGIYLGERNPEYENGYCYSKPPIDYLDYAAFRHDQAYDSKNVSGPLGAFLSRAVWKDDLQLAIRSIRDVTSAPFASKRQIYGIGTATLFYILAMNKYRNMLIPGGAYDEFH